MRGLRNNNPLKHQQWRNTISHVRHPEQYAICVIQIIVSLVSWS